MELAFVITSILFQIILSIVFITTFFFTYVTKIENNIVVKQVSEVISDFNRDSELILPDKVLNYLKENAPSIDTSQDAQVVAQNNKIRRTTFRNLWIGSAIGFIIVAVLAIIYKINLLELVASASFSVIAIAVAEFIFSTFFAQNYKTLDENYIKASLARIMNEIKTQ